MNIPMMKSGWSLGIRSAHMCIASFPNRDRMLPRWKQVKLCFKVIIRGLLEKQKIV